jgi:hypothetical protein
LSGVFGPKGQQSNARAPAGRRSRSLAPAMAGANHQNVVHVMPLT